ncbi:hypothetical protein B7463_g12637, partial [Scytalidium lignicola]
MGNLSDEIDSLFKHYLHLLDTYTALKSELSKAQSSIYQHIARANFSADRGHRYGQDSYDERIQALRVCNISMDESDASLNAPIFNTILKDTEDQAKTEDVQKDGAGDTDKDINIETPAASIQYEQSRSTSAQPKRKDPLHMFGILTPQPLRMAQSQSIGIVENIIPRIVTIDTEMKEVEIKIRRARKKRAKAKAVEEKEMMKMESKGETEVAS